jgi:hypothetical protein
MLVYHFLDRACDVGGGVVMKVEAGGGGEGSG